MDLTGLIINNKYELLKKINEGKISSLYLSNRIDSPTDTLAIKIFKDAFTSKQQEDIIRFKHELNIISRIDHPNVIKIFDSGEKFDLHFIVMEHLPGTSLSTIIKNSSLSVEQTMDTIIQVCEALICLHRSGIIHRNLRPGNIIINERDNARPNVKLTDGAVMHLMDFAELIKSGEIADLLAYMSPEQSGIKKSYVDERSDLYTLGVIFYQLLTGELPCNGDESFLVFHQHGIVLSKVPSAINPLVPEILDRIVIKLLETEPENRYQSAKGLLFDLKRVKGGERSFILGVKDASIRLSYRTRLVGREKELDTLKNNFERAQEGHGGVCLIKGEAGIGKTRLIEELREYAHSNSAVFIHTKCFSGENKEPYGQFIEALNVYLKIFSTYPDDKKKEIKDSIQAATGTFGEIILKLNPQMKEILGECTPLVQLYPERENERFLMVAADFFLNLSSIEDGLVLSIDDLQWSDEGTIEILKRITEQVARSPILIIGIYRNNEIRDGHGLQRFIRHMGNNERLLTEISMELFNYTTMNAFISSLLYENEKNVTMITDFMLQKSRGNPFFAIEIIKHLVDEKALYYENSRWNINDSILRRTVIPVTILEILIHRISFLGKDEATLLSYAAVIGKSFEARLLFTLLNEFSKDELVKIIDNCIESKLIEVDPEEKSRLLFPHDRIQEAFYGSIDPRDIKNMHARIAETLEKLYAGKEKEILFQLAHHYIESGNKNKSLEYAYPASFKAAANFANEEALGYFKTAVALLEEKISEDDSDARPLWVKSKEGMARVYLRIGKYDAAIEIFSELLPFRTNEIERALEFRNISWAYYKKGDWANSEEHARIGLALLGDTLPVRKSAVAVSIIKELMIHFLHILLPKLFIRKHPDAKLGKKLLHALFYESLIYTYTFSKRKKYVRSVLKVLNHVESHIGGGLALAKVLYAYGMLLMSFARFNSALKYLYKSLKISVEINDQFCIASNFQFIGHCYEWQGDYHKATEYYNKAVEGYTKIGDSNGLGLTLNGLSDIYFFTSDSDKLAATIEKYLEIAKKSNDNYQLSNALVLVSYYYQRTGKSDTAKAYAMEAYNLSNEHKIWMPHCVANISLARLHKNPNEIEKAVAYIEKAKELYEEHGFLKHYTIYLYPSVADIYIFEYNLKRNLTEKQKKFYLNRIRRSCILALRKTKRWASYHQQSLLVNAKYYALIKKNKKAEKTFLQSVNHCSRIGLKFDLAISIFEYGHFLAQSGNAEKSRMNFESAYQLFREIGADFYSEKLRSILGIKGETENASSIQRYIFNKRLDSIERICTQISQISDAELFLNAVIKSAVEVTFAHNGCLFVADGVNELELMSCGGSIESEIGRYSKEIVKKAYISGIPIITADRNDGKMPDGQSMELNREKSILSVPINTADGVIGVCYLEKYAFNGKFTEDDIELISMYTSKIAVSIYYTYLCIKLKSSKDGDKLTITPSIEEKISKIVSYIKENYKYDLSREGMASLIESNPDYFGRCFKKYTGYTISEFIKKIRIEEAAKKLRETDEKVIDIAYAVGFENLSTFNKTFYKLMKTIPTRYRSSILRIVPFFLPLCISELSICI